MKTKGASKRYDSMQNLNWLFLGWLMILPLQVQSQSFEVRGYLKNLGVVSESTLSHETFWFDATRLRTEGHFESKSSNIHTEIWLDTQLAIGNFFSTPEYALSKQQPRNTLFDLDWEISTGNHHVLSQNIQRAFLSYRTDKSRLIVGRQRIAWGTGFVWNPTDLLNPINPSAIEREEKAGVDALYGNVALGALSGVEAVVAPGWAGVKPSYAGRVSSHVGEYDITAMGGSFRGNTVVGGDFAGYVGNAGLRGEFAYVKRENATNYVRATLNTDYTFIGGYYIILEYHHNGVGERDKTQYNIQALLTGETFNLAKNYVAVIGNKAISPLVAATVYSIINLDDQSGLLGPLISWSPIENLDIGGGAYLFVGKNDTEFGQQSATVIGSIQYYF